MGVTQKITQKITQIGAFTKILKNKNKNYDNNLKFQINVFK